MPVHSYIYFKYPTCIPTLLTSL